MKDGEVPEVKQPKTLEDCFTILKEIVNGGELQMFKDYLETNAIAVTHHTLGRYLRNNWYLWWSEELAETYKDKGYPAEKPAIVKYFNETLGIKHPDHMSGIILASFHRFLNKKEIDIDAQSKRLREFEKHNMSL